VEQLSSKSLRKDIGFKTKVSYSDALLILNHWISSKGPFKARYGVSPSIYELQKMVVAKKCSNLFITCLEPLISTGRCRVNKEVIWFILEGYI
jgi:hypothetical protein